MDPLLVQMGNLHTLQTRLHHAHLNSAMAPNLSSTLPSETLNSGLSSLQQPPLVSIPPPMLGNMPNTLPGSLNRPSPHSTIDSLPPNQENDPITNFFKQLQQQKPVSRLMQKVKCFF